MALLRGNTLEEGKNVVEKREKQSSGVVEYQRLPPTPQGSGGPRLACQPVIQMPVPWLKTQQACQYSMHLCLSCCAYAWDLKFPGAQ